MAAPRICPHCGTANDKQATFCGACATQMVTTSTALVPVAKKSALPVLSQRDKATLGGVALGLAAMALRVGSLLLRQQAAAPKAAAPARPAPEGSPALLIRRRWVVGDGSGPLRWGEEEIELHRAADDPATYRISIE